MHCERRDQFRFASGLKAKMKFRTSVDDFFDHLAELIHLDREDSAVRRAITEFLHRALESAVHCLHPVAEKILESNDKRKTEAALAGLVHNLEQIDRASVFLQRLGNDVAGGVDGKVSTAPGIDVVGRDCGIDIPLGLRHWSAV